MKERQGGRKTGSPRFLLLCREGVDDATSCIISKDEGEKEKENEMKRLNAILDEEEKRKGEDRGADVLREYHLSQAGKRSPARSAGLRRGKKRSGYLPAEFPTNRGGKRGGGPFTIRS